MPVDLDPDSPDALYEQLAALLREAIGDGTYRSRLPSEPALASEYGVSRETARRAIRLLVAEGLLVTRHGRGTFVVQGRSHRGR